MSIKFIDSYFITVNGTWFGTAPLSSIFNGDFFKTLLNVAPPNAVIIIKKTQTKVDE